MHAKIQGGGSGRTANQGSSGGLVRYLEHEDWENIKNGKPMEPFFSHRENQVNPTTVIDKLDNNKRKLCKKDAKFYLLTLSPSADELRHLGNTPQEQSKKLKEFIRQGFMEQYAASFNKGLHAKDIMYYAKVHHHRQEEESGNVHVHVIVSRKTADGRRKISPQTNHKNTKKGPVKGGFSRVGFYNGTEQAFDRMFLYQRRLEDKFEYKKEYKKATPEEIERLVREKIEYNRQLEARQQEIIQTLHSIGFTDDQVNDLYRGKEVLSENITAPENDKKSRRARTYFMGLEEGGRFKVYYKERETLQSKNQQYKKEREQKLRQHERNRNRGFDFGR